MYYNIRPKDSHRTVQKKKTNRNFEKAIIDMGVRSRISTSTWQNSKRKEQKEKRYEVNKSIIEDNF